MDWVLSLSLEKKALLQKQASPWWDLDRWNGVLGGTMDLIIWWFFSNLHIHKPLGGPPGGAIFLIIRWCQILVWQVYHQKKNCNLVPGMMNREAYLHSLDNLILQNLEYNHRLSRLRYLILTIYRCSLPSHRSYLLATLAVGTQRRCNPPLLNKPQVLLLSQYF